MCNRYTLTLPDKIAAFPGFGEFSITRLPKINKRFNIAPHDVILGARNDGLHAVEAMQWGIRGRTLIPAESIAARRNPIRRRCIEFADGFFEWYGQKNDRRPVYYTLKNGDVFAFAGTWLLEGDAVHCDIVTTKPNELVANVHDRMPVILPPNVVDLWLDPDPLPPDVAASILQPYDANEMVAREVSKRVNNSKNDTPDILEPDASQSGPSPFDS